jgi:hypothetical protein
MMKRGVVEGGEASKIIKSLDTAKTCLVMPQVPLPETEMGVV